LTLAVLVHFSPDIRSSQFFVVGKSEDFLDWVTHRGMAHWRGHAEESGAGLGGDGFGLVGSTQGNLDP
jgi:hypothetical protein